MNILLIDKLDQIVMECEVWTPSQNASHEVDLVNIISHFLVTSYFPNLYLCFFFFSSFDVFLIIPKMMDNYYNRAQQSCSRG